MMTDTRFKWIVVAASVVTIVIAAMVIFRPSIRKEKPREKKPTKLEYVYLQTFPGVIHSDRKCKRLNYKNVASERMNPEEIHGDYTFCPYCVDDETYKLLQTRMSR